MLLNEKVLLMPANKILLLFKNWIIAFNGLKVLLTKIVLPMPGNKIFPQTKSGNLLKLLAWNCEAMAQSTVLVIVSFFCQNCSLLQASLKSCNFLVFFCKKKGRNKISKQWQCFLANFLLSKSNISPNLSSIFFLNWLLTADHRTLGWAVGKTGRRIEGVKQNLFGLNLKMDMQLFKTSHCDFMWVNDD